MNEKFCVKIRTRISLQILDKSFNKIIFTPVTISDIWILIIAKNRKICSRQKQLLSTTEKKKSSQSKKKEYRHKSNSNPKAIICLIAFKAQRSIFKQNECKSGRVSKKKRKKKKTFQLSRNLKCSCGDGIQSLSFSICVYRVRGWMPFSSLSA